MYIIVIATVDLTVMEVKNDSIVQQKHNLSV